MFKFPYLQNSLLFIWITLIIILLIGLFAGFMSKKRTVIILVIINVASILLGILAAFLVLKFEILGSFLKPLNDMLSATSIKLIAKDIYAIQSMIYGITILLILLMSNILFGLINLIVFIVKKIKKIKTSEKPYLLIRIINAAIVGLTFIPLAFMGSGLISTFSKEDSKISSVINSVSKVISLGRVQSFRDTTKLVESVVDAVSNDYSKPIVAYTLGLWDSKDPIKSHFQRTFKYSDKELNNLSKKLETKTFLNIYVRWFIERGKKPHQIVPYSLDIMKREWKNIGIKKLRVNRDVFNYIHNHFKKLVDNSNPALQNEYVNFVLNKFYRI